MSKKEISGKTPELNVDETRRRLAKAGAASVPVVLTLSSRPVWGGSWGGKSYGGWTGGGYNGGGGQCTISGMLSGNLSNPNEESCEGCTPGYWGQHPKEWPSFCEAGTCKDGWTGQHCNKNNYNNDGTRFHDIFGGNLYGDHTMMEVIHMAGYDDKYQLGAHACAAYLNGLKYEESLVNYGYTSTDIQNMYDNNWFSDPEGLKNTFAMLNERNCPL